MIPVGVLVIAAYVPAAAIDARQLATIFASIARRRPPRPASGSAGGAPSSEAA